jgi:hypothetical protein
LRATGSNGVWLESSSATNCLCSHCNVDKALSVGACRHVWLTASTANTLLTAKWSRSHSANGYRPLVAATTQR